MAHNPIDAKVDLERGVAINKRLSSVVALPIQREHLDSLRVVAVMHQPQDDAFLASVSFVFETRNERGTERKGRMLGPSEPPGFGRVFLPALDGSEELGGDSDLVIVSTNTAPAEGSSYLKLALTFRD